VTSSPATSLRHRALWSLIDQGLSSGTNFLMLFLVIRSSSTSAVGAFSLAYTTFFLVLAVIRGFAMEPLIVRYASATKDVWRAATSSAVGTALAVSVAVGLGTLVGGLISGGQVGSAFAALAVVLPGLIVQDSWRLAFFCAGRPRSACLNDLVFFVCQLAGYVAIARYNHFTVNNLILIWGLAAGIASIMGIISTGIIPRISRSLSWYRDQRDLGLAFATDYLAYRGSDQLAMLAIGGVAGLGGLGGVMAARSFFAPMTTVQTGLNAFAMPESARMNLQGRIRELRRFSLVYGLGLGGLMLAEGVGLYFIPPYFGVSLFHDNWLPARSVLIPMTAFSVVTAIAGGMWVGLRGMQVAKQTLYARSATGAASIIATVIGAKAGGAQGAVWGMTAGAIVLTAVMAALLYRQRDHVIDSLSLASPPFRPLAADFYTSTPAVSSKSVTASKNNQGPVPRPRVASAKGTSRILFESPTRSQPSLRTLAVPAAIGVFILYVATSVYARGLDRPLFTSIEVVTFFACIGRTRDPYPERARSLRLVWLSVSIFYFGLSLLQADWLITYAGGDFALSLLPLLFMFAILRDRTLITSNTVLYFLIGVTGLAAIEASLIGTVGPRFTPPSPFLIGATWYLLIHAKTRSQRLGAVPLTGMVGYLAYASGFRTHIFLWVLAPVIVLLLSGGWRRILILAAAILIGISGLGAAGHPIDFTSVVSSSRLHALVSGNTDSSLQSRLFEVDDIISTSRAEWSPGQALVGSGFGASYVPQQSDITRNIVSNGRVHSIHIGPALVYFRYGFIGIGTMLLLVAFLFSMGRRIRRSEFDGATHEVQAVFFTSLVLFLLEFLTLNATVEPLMSLSLGGLLAIWAIDANGKRIGRKNSLRAINRRKVEAALSAPAPRVDRGLGSGRILDV
jgi:O-antigen/teichoic acid export membrane protein